MNIRVTAQPLPLRVPEGISLPASKSISNRMLLLRTLSGGEIRLHNISDCDDTIAMEQGLKSLGVQSPAIIDVGAAGTAMRFLTAYFATTESQDVIITGTERMRHRPIGVLVDALRSMGANISYDGEDGYPPLHIKGRQLEGGAISLPGNVSSQYISALLMVAPTMQKGLTLSIIGEVISRPYINITTSLMRHFGISIEEPDERTIIVHPGMYRGGEYTIENDWSAASYWYGMLALAPEGEVRLQGLFADSLQGDSCVRQLFEPLGITTEFDENGAVLRKSSRVNSQWSVVNAEGIASGSSAVGGAGADFKEPRERSGNGQCSIINDLTTCPDLAQTMVATCCGMGVAFRFSGLQSLRIKETDRLLALQQELSKLGYRITEHDGSILESEAKREGLENSKSSNNKSIDTYNDHRMAMCMAPLAVLCKDGLIINDAQVVSKSYPTFWDDLKTAGYGIERL
ncbi:MAG: 3-phosphoshikimate 1-carboxyvinyltransferase [Bacteroidaceae bacterium]|nr:3-phosphoshikimate 1-carboxyvinyltransferase [Bacteroidaceae bacterium]